MRYSRLNIHSANHCYQTMAKLRLASVWRLFAVLPTATQQELAPPVACQG